MITIFANWTQHSIKRAETVEKACALLTFLDCEKGTKFGSGQCDLTAIEGVFDFDLPLYKARKKGRVLDLGARIARA